MDKVDIDGDPDGLFNAVNGALDLLALQAKTDPRGAAEDWISVSIPKLRANASPLIHSALDALESNPAHQKMFQRFVTDATENPAFRESLKKSLRDPQITTLVKAMMGKQLPKNASKT